MLPVWMIIFCFGIKIGHVEMFRHMRIGLTISGLDQR